MIRFVLGEVLASDCFRQRFGLQKGQTHAFARNGIDGSGRIANQRHAAARHAPQNKVSSHRAALRCRRIAVRKSRGDIWEERQRLAQPQFRIPRKHHDANFVRGNRRDIQLRFFGPVAFNAIRPRRTRKVLPKRKPHSR